MKLKLLLFLIFPVLQASAQTSIQPNAQKLDSLFDYLQEKNYASGTVEARQGNRILYQRFFGQADFDKKQDFTKDNLLRIGSVTKMFTAIMIFQLAEEQKLKLSTKLSTFFPQIKQASEITISMMLGHRSGLASITDDTTYLQKNTKHFTQNEIIDWLKGLEPVFSPGEKAAYSNSNYILLGYIIEKVTKKSYAENLEQRITKPLGLKHTFYAIQNSELAVPSFENKTHKWVAVPFTDLSIPAGAGSIQSTAGDLNVFIQGLFNKKIISQPYLDTMTRIVNHYGKGIFQLPFYQKKLYGHSGGIDAFNSMLLYNPTDSVSVAIITNGLYYDFNKILIGLLSCIYQYPFEIPKISDTAIALSEEKLASYEGTYGASGVQIELKFFVEKGQLKAQATGQSDFPLTPTDENTFEFSPAGIKITFKDPEDKHFRNIHFTQGSANLIFTRKSEAK